MGAANYIFANTGQLVRLVIQTQSGCQCDGYNTPGALSDGYIPIVLGVMFPDLSQAAGYPQNMTRLGFGLYAHGIQIPTGADALGTYIAQVYWEEKGQPKNAVFAINVARPFGIANVTPI
jgi:hypothetical protein